jgi:hypothetical protein
MKKAFDLLDALSPASFMADSNKEAAAEPIEAKHTLK